MVNVTRSMVARGCILVPVLAALMGCFGIFCTRIEADILAYVGSERVLTPPGLFMNGVWREHFAYAGRPVLLKGALRDIDSGASYTYSWDFGDGSSSGPLAVTRAEALQAFHTYADTTPGKQYTAVLSVMKGSDVVGQANYPISFFDSSNKDVKLAVSIEDGLWFLHRRMDRTILSGVKIGLFGNDVDTELALLALLYHSHKPAIGGGASSDPYTDDVERLLNYVFSTSYKQVLGAPYDTNGNGYGLYSIGAGSVPAGTAAFQPQATGVMLAAISQPGVADYVLPSGIPEIAGKTVQQLLPEYAEYLYWSQSRTGTYKGGWGRKSNEVSSMEQTGWAALGLAYAKAAGVLPGTAAVPPNDWKSLLNGFLTSDQNVNGSYGDQYPSDYPSIRTTASSLSAFWDVDALPGDTRLQKAQQYITQNWLINTTFNKHFGDLRAMALLAQGSDRLGITNYGAKNWKTDYSDWTINNQNADTASTNFGSWSDTSFDGSSYNPSNNSPASTAWVLLFRRDIPPPCLPATACLHVTSVQIKCDGGYATLDARCSSDNNPVGGGIDIYEFTLCDGTKYTESTSNAPDGVFDGTYYTKVCDGKSTTGCTASVRVHNTCGLWSSPAVIQIQCPVSPAPTCNLTTPVLQANGSVLMDASGSTDASGLAIVRYTFTFSDGTPSYTETTTNAPDGLFDGRYFAPCNGSGTKTVSVQVENCLGIVSLNPCSATYECCKPPVCNVTTTCQPNCNVLVDASGTTDPGPCHLQIVSFSFVFSDGTPAYTETPANHPDGAFDGKYLAPSVKGTVTVTVTNSAGKSSSCSTTYDCSKPPVCSVTTSCQSNCKVLVDASGSSDPCGLPITSYAFTFSDGTPAYTETNVSAPDGIFDGKYLSASVKGTVTVTAANSAGKTATSNASYDCSKPPVCSVSTTCQADCKVLVDASGSSDPCGLQITSFVFTFTDGTPTYTETNISAPDGAFDGKYLSPSVKGTVTVTAANSAGKTSSTSATYDCSKPPVCSVSTTCQADCKVLVDASGSSDPCGLPIRSYAFTFSDGTPAYTETNTSAPDGAFDGRYIAPSVRGTVTVTVTNSAAKTATNSATYDCSKPPVCNVTASCSPGCKVQVNASGSSDPCGLPITSYTFTFSDGSPSYTETNISAPDGVFDGKYLSSSVQGTVTATIINNAGKSSTCSTTYDCSNPTCNVITTCQPNCNVLVDASGSLDSCGLQITSYMFAFSDGTPTYTETQGDAPDGTFDGKYLAPSFNGPVTVTITSASGKTASCQATYDCSKPVCNVTATCKPGCKVLVDASTSMDLCGLAITSYSFVFSDGTPTYTETAISHPDGAFDGKYLAISNYGSVTVTISNSAGKTSTCSTSYDCSVPPICQVTATCQQGCMVLLDASGSTDPCGIPITSYSFLFSDDTPTYTESATNAPDGVFDGKYLASSIRGTVTVVVTTASGKTSSCTQTYDCSNPTCNVTTTCQSSCQVLIDASASTDSCGLAIDSYKFEFNDGTPTYTETKTIHPDGKFDGKYIAPSIRATVTVTVTNSLGSTSTCVKSYDCSTPPVCNVSVRCPSATLIDASASTPQCTIKCYEFVTKDGSGNTIQTYKECRGDVEFDGRYLTQINGATVTVIVTDDYGRTSTCADVPIPCYCPPSDQAPVANPGGPYNACSGSPIILDGRASYDPDAGDGIADYSWTISPPGHNTPVSLSGATPAVTFTQTGVYTVCLTVRENNCPLQPKTNTKCTSIVVQECQTCLPVFQAAPGESDQVGCAGYLGMTTVPFVTAAAGVLKIEPGPGWSNFMQAPNGTLTSVTLTKEAPDINEPCQGVQPYYRHRFKQSGRDIRLTWPLMFELPGTRWSLTVKYTTPTAVQLPGENTASTQHTSFYCFQVEVDIDHLINLLDWYRMVPFGLSSSPLISDEDLYAALREQLITAKAAFDGGDISGAAASLSNFALLITDSCIYMHPPQADSIGPFTGIAQTLEFPACCILTIDTAHVIRELGNP